MNLLLILAEILLLLFFGGTMSVQTPPATQSADKAACKLAFLDAKQVGVTRVINVETGADEGTVPTDGLIAPTGGRALRFIKQDGETRLAVDQYVGLGRQYIMTAIDGDVVRATWSPDGMQVAVIMKKDKRQNLYLVDAGGTKLTRITNWDQVDDYPVWTSDTDYGTQLHFLSLHSDGTTSLYVLKSDLKSLDGGTTFQKLPLAPFMVFANFGMVIGVTDPEQSIQVIKIGSRAPMSITRIDKPVLELVRAPDSTLIALSIGGDLYLIDESGTDFRPVPGKPAGSQLAWLCGDVGASNPRRR